MTAQSVIPAITFRSCPFYCFLRLKDLSIEELKKN